MVNIDKMAKTEVISYGQNHIDYEIMDIYFVFLPNFGPKIITLVEALKSSLNVFGILGTCTMGKQT